MIFENKGGLDTVDAFDLIPMGSYAYLQNVRKLLGGRMGARPPLGGNLLPSPLPAGVTSLTRMKDPYMGAPGYALIESAAGKVYVNATQVVSGLSGNPVSFLPYRPPSSPQPWCYLGDANGMWKIRSDGTTWKTGIAEPQVSPAVTSIGGGRNSIVYRDTYRSTTTGATSNPSPESAPQFNGSGSGQIVSWATDSTQWRINANQWEYVSGQWRTIDSWGDPGRLFDPIYTQNMGLISGTFPVPDGVVISGIEFDLQWQNQPGGTPGTLVNCQLSYQGTLLGTQKLPGIESNGTVTDTIIGNAGDLWGANLSPAILNDPSFGIEFQIYQGAYNGTSHRIFVNHVYVTIYWATQNAVLQSTGSSDPQVDVIDHWRMGGPLENFTYVGTSPNGSPPPAFTDILDDLAAALNPVLSFANYEPFPSIDLPRKGVCDVAANGALTAVSGDDFNIRWLPGTIVLVAGVAYVLYNRPSSTTAMIVYNSTVSGETITFGYPPVGANIAWEIAEPILAAEPSPVIWGPTPDNAGSFYFGLDSNNPGDLVWSMGNNFDSAPDTNRMYVTSPSEPLMNGVVTSELSTVFSTERFWLIYPNFSDAVAAVTGTLGQQWTLVQAASKRGLYMRYAIAALASMIAWRAKDGIFVSQGGGPEEEISQQIYNLFPHGETNAPAPVVIGAYTVYPPDDTKPNAQTITLVPGYLFYDYQDTNGNPRTLVYDMEAKGWSVDVTAPVANCHALPVADNQILLGCVDGSVRAFDTNGSESGTAIIATASVNGGSARKTKRVGAVFLRAKAESAVTMEFWGNRYQLQIVGVTPLSVGPVPVEQDYFADFSHATGNDVLDLAGVFSFPVGSENWLKEWQPDWTDTPEHIAAWRTGLLSYGMRGWLHAPWIRFAYESPYPLRLTLQTDQNQVIPINVPPSIGGKFFSWLPPNKFHMMEWIVESMGGAGASFVVYGADIEMAVGEWGRTAEYTTLRPFRQQDGSST